MKVSLGDLVDRLSIVNQKIWHLESSIRKGKLDNDLLEVGRRAVEIRNLNKERVSIKDAINEYTDYGFKEVKVNHLSQ